MGSLRPIMAFVVMCTIIAVGSAQSPKSAFDSDPWPVAKTGPVKVFILAGQSNMQGHAALRTLEYLIYNERTASEYQQWKDRWGDWYERSDVWIWTTDGERHGNLRPGFGQNEKKIGPELGFGWVVGETLDEQVLLIKTCWGGRSIRQDFLPPSAEMPSAEELEKELDNARKRNPNATMDEIKGQYGKAYQDMIRHIHDVLSHLRELFPNYDQDRGYELAGLVWFQGWNDMVDGQQRAEKYVHYTERLSRLITDVRKDLKAPNLPVVIGELGAAPRGDFQAAQAAVAQRPEFSGNVTFVKTREFWEPDVEEMVKDSLWNGPDWARFYNVGSERGYHYLGSARIYYQMGKAFGEALLQMRSAPVDGAEAGSGPAIDDIEAIRFDPMVRQIEGWTVYVDPSLLKGEHSETGGRALKMLANHLQRIAVLLPERQLAEMQKLEVWIEYHHPTLSAMQYHPSIDWLTSHGHDPRLAKKVHIPRAADLLERHQMIKQPAVILHELAHAYHDQYLGFDDRRIIEAYDKAKEARIYENVLRYDGKMVPHYSLTDHKEYFAEGTEAFFYRNDFYPFCRAELKEHDPLLHDLLIGIWGPLE